MSEESRVGFAYLKAIFHEKILKAFIPCSRSLLKPIERLMELVDVVGKFWILAWWLLHIYQFLNWSIEEGTLHIHLIEFEVVVRGKGNQNPN